MLPNWLKRRPKPSRWKEAECHRFNYDKHSRAAALEVGDMVLVHVTTFKGHHKIQYRWENREYVVERWPYPDVPVYVVCPRDGDGYSWTLCRNYLLAMNSNIGHDEKDMHPWQELKITTLQLQCHLWTVCLLMQDHLGWSHQAQQVTHPRAVWISLLHLNAVCRKPMELTSMEVLEFWLTGRYQSIWHLGCMNWCVYLFPCHILSVNCFWQSTMWITLYLHHHVSAKHYSVLTLRGILSMCSLQWIFGWWGSGPKDIWPMCSCPTVK